MDNDNEHNNDNIWHTEFLSQFSTIATKVTYFSSLSMLECVCVCFNNDNNTEKSFKNEISLKNKNPPFWF